MDGLENVVVAETVLSDVDGAGGRLVIRGVPIEVLADGTPFEAAAHLLLEDLVEDLPDEDAFAARLGRARAEAFAAGEALFSAVAGLPPVDAIRALIALLPDTDDLDAALRLIAAPAVFTAAVLRVRAGEAAVRPDPALPHAADTLRMMRGQAADRPRRRRWTPISSPSSTTGSTPRPSRRGWRPPPARGSGSAVLAGLSTL